MESLKSNICADVVDGKLFLKNLPSRSEIRIYSLKGELLHTNTITQDYSVIDLNVFNEHFLIVQVAGRTMKILL